MSDVLESAKTGLQGKLGPVPVWAIAGGIGLVSVGGYYVYARKAAAATAAAAPTSAVADGAYATTGNTVNTSLEDATAAAAPATNVTWVASATVAVATSLSASPLEVSAALVKYLSGNQLTPKEKTYVDAAISAKGYPPDGLNGISDVVDPVAAAQAATDAQNAQDARDRAAADAENNRQLALIRAQADADAAAAERDRQAQAAAQAAADAAERTAAAQQATQVQYVNTPSQPAAPSYTNENRPLNSTFNISASHAGYISASDANLKKNKKATVNPGSYTLLNRQNLSSGYVIEVRPSGGGASYWINI